MSSALREAVRQVLLELVGTMPPAAQALLNVGPPSSRSGAQPAKSTPPPLPAAAKAQQKPASAALPGKDALTKFKSSLNMAADAGARAKQASEQANTKEALRWLDKTIEYATAAKKQLVP